MARPGGGEGGAQVVGGFAARKREEAINGEIKPKLMGSGVGGGSGDNVEADRRIIWNSML